MNQLQQATKTWIESVQKYYENTPRNELTQIYMRGYWSGWSEREVLEFANKLAKNDKDYPLYRENEQ
jgi:methyl coenzyme M reductase alpha subunit